MQPLYTLFFLFLFNSLTSHCQITLAYDYPANAQHYTLRALGNSIISNPNNDTFGRELWKYDISTGNSQLIYDLAAGNLSSTLLNSFEEATVWNGILYFPADSNDINYLGDELWAYDGVNPPSFIKDIYYGPLGSQTHFLTGYGSRLYFLARDTAHGFELFTYDPLQNSVSCAVDINPGPAGSSIMWIVPFNGKILLAANIANTGMELYAYDTATQSVSLIFDIVPGTGSSNPKYPYVDGNILYFIATTPAYGNELYSYNGITAPIRLTDICPGPCNGVPNLTMIPNLNIMDFNSRLYFTADDGTSGMELYEFDPNTNSVGLVYDINPTGNSVPRGLTVFGNKMYFNAIDGANNWELWVYDGISSPFQVADINPGPNHSDPTGFLQMGDKLYFIANDGNGRNLYYIQDSTLTVKRSDKGIDVNIYPNPADEEILLDVSLESPISLNFSIANSSGVLVYESGALSFLSGKHKRNCSIKHLPPGIYYYWIKSTSGQTINTGKLEKK